MEVFINLFKFFIIGAFLVNISTSNFISSTISYNFTTIFGCSNLLHDIWKTLELFNTVSNIKNMSLPEKFFVANVTCTTTTLMAKDLDEDLCALETENVSVTHRDKLHTFLEEKRKLYCDYDFQAVKSKQIQFFSSNYINNLYYFEGEYWRNCNLTFQHKEPECRRKGAFQVRGLQTEKYILNNVGNLREINLTLDTGQVIKSCCSMVFIRNCIEDFYTADCRLLNNTERLYNNSKRFFDKAISLLGCDIETCFAEGIKESFWFLLVAAAINYFINLNIVQNI